MAQDIWMNDYLDDADLEEGPTKELKEDVKYVYKTLKAAKSIAHSLFLNGGQVDNKTVIAIYDLLRSQETGRIAMEYYTKMMGGGAPPGTPPKDPWGNLGQN